MKLFSKQLNIPADDDRFDYKEPKGLKKWWENQPREGWLKKTAQWFEFKHRRYISDPYYNCKHGISNLYNYFWVVWGDRSWDYSGTYDILGKKFELLRKTILENANHVDFERDCRDMKIAIELLKRLKDEHYEMEYFDYQKSKFEFEPIEGSTNFTLNTDIIWEKWDDFLAKYPNVVRKLNKEHGTLPEKSRLVHMVADYNQERANKLFYKLLEERLCWWWD